MAVKYNQQNDQTRQIAGLPLTGTREERLRQRIEGYVWDDDPNVQEHIEWFLDQKLGLMIHWGVYSQLGMKESWPLIDHSSYGNNPKWTRWQFPEDTDPKEFKAMYSNLHKTFNPVRFDPDEWAEFAKDAGFKYLLFTTKHHDGFCMWDTKVTNYSVTGPESPYFDNEYRYLKKGNQKFVYRLYEDNETVPLSVSFKAPFEVNSVNYMRTGQSLDFTQTGDILNVKMPLGIVGLSGIMADGFNIK